MKVKVIDAMPGEGKTSCAIQMIQEETNNPFGTRRFIYVTPYLDEVERIKASTNGSFFDPVTKNAEGSKLKNIKTLIRARENIVTTHALFGMLDEETLELIECQGYTLIMDEVANVLEQFEISTVDLKILIDSKCIKVNYDGLVSWVGGDYLKSKPKGRFSDIKALCDSGCLILHKACVLFSVMPIDAFQAFKEVYLLTYLFKGQIQSAYFELYGIEYTMYSVAFNGNSYELLPYDPSREDRSKFIELIHVYEDRGKSKLNTNYDKTKSNYALSSSWLRKADAEQLQVLRSNIYNFFKGLGVKVGEVYWSTLMAVAPILKGEKNKFRIGEDGKVDSDKCNFVALNIRATNKYKNCKACAYIYNRFMNPMEKQFFTSRGVEVNEDLLAVSDLLQFLFRGRIRDGKCIDAYIPSKRMRELLYAWVRHEI